MLITAVTGATILTTIHAGFEAWKETMVLLQTEQGARAIDAGIKVVEQAIEGNERARDFFADIGNRIAGWWLGLWGKQREGQ